MGFVTSFAGGGPVAGFVNRREMSTSQVARRWGKSRDTVIRWFEAGIIPLVALPRPSGGHYRFTSESVEEAEKKLSLTVE